MSLQWKRIYKDPSRRQTKQIDHQVAEGGKGTYRLAFIRNNIYRLSIQPTLTRGMLDIGQFRTRREAVAKAEEHDATG